MKILIVSATRAEVEPLFKQWPVEVSKLNEKVYLFKHGNASVDLLITGAGMFATAYEMGAWLARKYYDLIIGVGIAGSFNKKLQLGSVVQVQCEQFGDLGIEEDDGFTPINQLSFFDPNKFPFNEGKLNNNIYTPTLKTLEQITPCKGVSVNTVSGRVATIRQLLKLFKPDVETMENAAFMYACLSIRQPYFIALRAISNVIDQRSKQEWNIPLAVAELHKALFAILDECSQKRRLG